LSAEDIQAVFERFDEDKSNTIEFVELKKWL
jgi:Ca2+-binding EF-hand superfamily protein